MVSDMELLEEIDARLAAVADTQFVLIQRYREQIEAAAELETLTSISEPLDRAARSIRLTYALRVKLRKDVRSLDREETRMAEARHLARSQAQWDGVRHRVQALTWREADWEDEDLLNELDRALDFESLDPGFLDLTPEQQADRLIQRLGLTAEPCPPPQGEVSAKPTEGASASTFHSSA